MFPLIFLLFVTSYFSLSFDIAPLSFLLLHIFFYFFIFLFFYFFIFLFFLFFYLEHLRRLE